MDLLLCEFVALMIGRDLVWNIFARAAADPANGLSEPFSGKIVFVAIPFVANEAAMNPSTVLARLVFLFRLGISVVVVMVVRRPRDGRVQKQE